MPMYPGEATFLLAAMGRGQLHLVVIDPDASLSALRREMGAAYAREPARNTWGLREEMDEVMTRRRG